MSRRVLGTLAVVGLVGGALRLLGLSREPLWLDEVLSGHFVADEYSSVELVTQLPLEDPHPPLYYLLLDGWTVLAGTGDWALRFPSVVFSTAGIGAMFLLARRVYDDGRAGLVAAGLTALSPYQLAYAQEARMYALLFLTTAAATWTLLGWLDEGGRRWTWGYGVAAVALGYTHVFGLFVLAIHAAYGLLRVRRDVAARRWLRTTGAIAAALAPFVAVLAHRVLTGGTGMVSWISEPALVDVPVALVRVTVGGLGTPAEMVALWGIGMGLCGAVGMTDRGGSAIGLLVALVLGPAALAFVLSLLVQPIFVTRYLIGAAVGVYALAGGGVLALADAFEAPGPRRAGQAALAGLVCVLAVGLLLSCAVYFESSHKPAWPAVADHVEEAAADDEAAVLITESYMRHPLHRYSERPVAEPLSDEAPADSIRRMTAGHDELVVVKARANGRILDAIERAGWAAHNHTAFRGIGVRTFRRAG